MRPRCSGCSRRASGLQALKHGSCPAGELLQPRLISNLLRFCDEWNPKHDRTCSPPAPEPRIPPDFTHRADLATHPELMDGPCTFEQLRGCLHNIARVNRLFRAYTPTLQYLEEITQTLPRQDRPLHILDVGCGYGDMLRRIALWAHHKHIPVRLTGMDRNPDAIRAAREATPDQTITLLHGDADAFHPEGGIDLILSSLVTHHMEDSEIIDLLRWQERTARLGWFINDLHRQPLPYYAFRLIARLTPWHPFVKHDGAVSILRSFRPADWHTLCAAAEIPSGHYHLREHRPARLCVARFPQAS